MKYKTILCFIFFFLLAMAFADPVTDLNSSAFSSEIKADYNFSELTNSFVTIENNLNIEIGNTKEAEFKPELTISKWNKETEFTIGFNNTVDLSEPNIITEKEKIKLIKNNYELWFYKKTEGYEFELVLKSNPGTNELSFPIQTKNLVFEFQPPLNEEESQPIDKLDCNATQCVNEKKEVVIERPKNIVGSYAVYHSSKANNEFKTGKAFHIYRPIACDSLGLCVYADLNIQENQLTISLPSIFLLLAVYPVSIDPEFGYLTCGATGITVTGGLAYAALNNSLTASTGDTLTKISACQYELTPENSHSFGGVYDDSGGVPNNRVSGAERLPETGNTGLLPTHDVNSGTLSVALSNGVTYYPASGDSNSDTRLMYDSGSGTNYSRNQTGGIGDPWVSNGTGTQRISVYATYTTGGGESSCDLYSYGSDWVVNDVCYYLNTFIDLGSGKLFVGENGLIGLEGSSLIISGLDTNRKSGWSVNASRDSNVIIVS